MTLEYTLYDHFDKKMEKPIKRKFNNVLSIGEEFTVDDVGYKVTKTIVLDAKKPIAFVRMVKYRIPNTATQFMHYCPAEKKRIKMQGHMAIRCPYCKVTFWKESMEFPEAVEVPAEYGKQKRKKFIKRKTP